LGSLMLTSRLRMASRGYTGAKYDHFSDAIH
jgi:hypothetical protein